MWTSSSQRALKNHKGFAIAEIIVGIAIMAVTLTSIAMLMNKSIRVKKTSEALTSIKKITEALEITYREATAYNELNCAGWGDGNCASGKITPTITNSTTISAWLPTQSGQKAWDTAGCTLTSGGNNNFSIVCQSGYGVDFTFANAANTQTAGGMYLNGYNKTPYAIQISVTIPGGTTNIQETWSSGYLDAEYYEKANQKILSLLRALKSYHFNKMLYEANNNVCTAGAGGLSSTDDALIPWVWQLTATTPTNAQSKCSGIESGNCGCASFTSSIWNNTTAYLQIDTPTEINTILDNMGLDRMYRTDSYGNLLTLRLLADRNGDALTVLPARPKVTYSDCLPSGTAPATCSTGAAFQLLPPYTGIAGILNSGSWVFSHKVVYAN